MLRLGKQHLIHDFGIEKYNWASGAVMFPSVRMSTEIRNLVITTLSAHQ